MRKITEQSVSAFINGQPFHGQNMATDGKALLLHGNKIAEHGTSDGRKGVFLTLSGWDTPTTKERLKGVLRFMGHQSWRKGGRDVRPGYEGDPCLNVWTKGGQTYLGDVRRPTAEAFKLDADTIVFVAHPIHARGMAAIEASQLN